MIAFGGEKTLTELDEHETVTLAGKIVSAFVSNNTVHVGDLPQLIAMVHSSLKNISAPQAEPAPPAQAPAVPIRKSITDDYLVCLEDGKRFKSLKRHLQQAFGLTPDEYRSKWGLARDYPMVAPGYAAKRSQLAKESGLGSDRRKRAPAAPAADVPASAPDIADPAPPKKRGRPRTRPDDAEA